VHFAAQYLLRPRHSGVDIDMDETQLPQLADDGSDRPTEEAGQIAGAAAADAAEPVVDSAALNEDDPSPPSPDLLQELAAAMHATAARERERIEAAITDRSTTRVGQLRERSQVESDELRRLAAEDVERIDEWAATEMDRIRIEARRRSDERRAALEDYLTQHDTSVEAEIGRVGKAVAVYRERLDAFFKEVDATTDPAAIARLAGSLPELPDLEHLLEEAAPAAPAAVTPSPTVVAEEGAARAEAEAVEESRAEVEAEAQAAVVVADASPAAEPDEALEEAPLVGVMAAAAPAPVMPLTAIVSAPPASPPEGHIQAATATAEQSHPRGALGLLRTIAPWTRHDDRDTTAASADVRPEDNGH
jgi:ribosomal protein L12E/L44/L45/RPP1/RPP2